MTKLFGRFFLFFCLISLFLCRSALADGMIIIERPPIIVRPFPPQQPIYLPLEVREHHVSVSIKNQIATTQVDQTFFNPTGERLEGTYIFPIPKDARIDKFSLDINGKMTDAELLDAQKARQIYEDIVRRMKDPALLEYAGQGMFKLRIFPIEPHSEKRIRLSYSELLREDGSLVHYRYPLNTEKFSAQPLKSLSLKVELESSRPIKSIYSPSHSVETRRSGDNKAIIGYEASNVKPDTDFELFFAPEVSDEVALNFMAYNDASDEQGGYFLLLASPPTQISADKTVKKDVAFVLDTSGSMADGGKLEQAKKALQFCLSNLNSGDRFEIVRFSTEAEPLFGRLTEASVDNIAKASQFFSSLKPNGGTAIEDALSKALDIGKDAGGQGRPYLVVFLTDGMPTVGATNEDQIISSVMKKAGDRAPRIFSFGVGTDVNTHLLDKLTEKTKAASQYVLPKEDLEIKVSNFYSKINEPVLADLKLEFSGAVRVNKMEPAVLPDLFKGEQLAVFGRYSGSGSTAIRLSGQVNAKKQEFTYEATFPQKAQEYSFIAPLWATRRVGYLLDQIRLHGEEKELRDEAAELARRYGIVTPYTAYLVVEDESQRNVPLAARSLAAPVMEEKREMESMWNSAQRNKSGADAVGGAQAFGTLKGAYDLGAASVAKTQAMEAGSSFQKKAVQNMLESQQIRRAGGKTFYLRSGQWVDAKVQDIKDAAPVVLKFNSEEYFALLREHPETAPWLALGAKVSFVLKGKVYQVE